MEFGHNDSKVVLKPRQGYVPIVLSTPFRAQVITLSALPPSDEDRELSLLCPVKALRIYFERSAPFRRSEQLFVSFGNHARGHPVKKQRLSRWIVDAVTLAYSSLGLYNAPSEYEPIPQEVSPHRGRGLAVCLLQRSVWWPAGPRRPHLLGFITWTYRPYRPESSLLNGTFTHGNHSDGEPLTARCSSSLIGCLYVSARGVPKMQESSGTITQAGRDLYEFSPF